MRRSYIILASWDEEAFSTSGNVGEVRAPNAKEGIKMARRKVRRGACDCPRYARVYGVGRL